MEVEVTTIVKDVRTAIDMNRSDTELVALGDADTLELDDIIRSVVEEAVMLTHMDAPVYLLDNTEKLDDSTEISWNDGDDVCSGVIVLPSDFMRLVSFRMSDWRRTVHEALSSEDAQYKKCSSPYAGVAGTWERPVVAITKGGNGLLLEFYSCRSSDGTISDATYVPYPTVSDGKIEISKRCYKAAVYRAAALALATLGDQQSGTMAELSKSLLV